MAKVMKGVALWSTILTVLCVMLYRNTEKGLLLTLAITFGTVSYHFLMRLAIGTVVDRLLHNHVNYRAGWFRVGTAEQALYKRLQVRKWKGRLPTYAPHNFDRRLHSWEEIAQAMCQAELVHELIIPFSFLPLLAAVPFGSLGVFAITSFAAALFDAAFVVMQRYNRPRVLRLCGLARRHEV